MGRRRGQSCYDPATIDALKGVSLPDKIKCGRCNKYKNQKSYSNKQLTDARLRITNEGKDSRYSINCMACTGQQVVEIECTVCYTWKGLEDYAKSQRTKPDEAECYACVDDRLNQNPVSEDIYTGEDRTKAIAPADDDVATNWPSAFTSIVTGSDAGWKDSLEPEDDGGIPLSEDFQQKLSVRGSDHETLIDAEYDRGSQVGANEWQTVHTKSWHTNSARTPSNSFGFNPNKYGKPPTRSSASHSGSVHTFSSGYAERDTASSGWAKIKAYDPRQDLAMRRQSEPEPAEEEEWSDDEDDKAPTDDYDSDDTDTEI